MNFKIIMLSEISQFKKKMCTQSMKQRQGLHSFQNPSFPCSMCITSRKHTLSYGDNKQIGGCLGMVGGGGGREVHKGTFRVMHVFIS